MFGGLDFTAESIEKLLQQRVAEKASVKKPRLFVLEWGIWRVTPKLLRHYKRINIRRYLNGGEGISHLSGAS